MVVRTQGVASLDVLRAGIRIISIKVLVRRCVDRTPAVYDLAEFWRQLFIRGVPRGPQSVSSDGGYSVIVQVKDARWLAFMNLFPR
jgi:hypothetical protein